MVVLFSQCHKSLLLLQQLNSKHSTTILVCNTQWTEVPPYFEYPVSIGNEILEVKTYVHTVIPE